MSFDYTIKADASAALAASKQVEESLERVLRANENAGEAFAKAARKAADEQGRALASATRRAAELDQQMGSMRGFDALSAHFQREADVLERLRAPYREHMADVSALASLYKRGQINAAEYTAELQRMNGAAHGGGVGEGIAQGTGLAVLGGGAAGLAAAGSAKALELAHDVLDLGDAYTNLDNRMKRVSATEEQRAYLMTRTKEIANATRSEWAATGELYVRLTNATKDMNLGQERVLGLTETINKAFAMSGASSSEAAAGMLQLSQAFASGHLQGDEFRSLAEAVPDVLQLIAKQMGVSQGKLKELGSEGKITADVLVAAFESSKKSIDEGFAKTAPTLSQQWAVFKNDMTETIGKLVKDTDLLSTTGDAIKNLASAINTLAGAYRDFKAAKDAVGGTFGGGGSKSIDSEAPTGLGFSTKLATGAFGYMAPDETITEKQKRSNEIMHEYGDVLERARDQGKMFYQVMIDDAAAQATWNGQLQSFLDKTSQIADDNSDFSRFLANTRKLKDDADNVDAANKALSNMAITLDSTTWGAWTNGHEKSGQAIKAGADIVGGALDVYKTLAKNVDVYTVAIQAAVENTVALPDTFEDVIAAGRDLDDSLNELAALMQFDNATSADFADAINTVTQKVADLADTGMQKINQFSLDFGSKLADLAKKIKTTWDDDIHKHHPLSLEEKLYQQIKGPMLEYMRTMDALDRLLAKHRITTAEYRTEMSKLAQTLGGVAAMLDDLHKQARKDIEAGAKAPGVGGGLDFNEFLENPGVFDPRVVEAATQHRLEMEQELAEESRKAQAELQPDLKADLDLAEKNTEQTRKWHDEIKKISADHDALDGIKKGLDDVYKEATNVSEVSSKLITDAFHNMEDALVQAAMTGKFTWSTFLHELESDLTRLAIRILEMRILTAAFGGGVGAGLGGSTFLLHGGAHADGGSYVVPGAGGPDSQNVMFALTPGERVDFTPPGQGPKSGGVKIVNSWDPRALLDEVGTYDGAVALHNTVRRNPRIAGTLGGGRRR